MSLTLLAPLGLIAAGLLAVPIVIHLFKPRRVRQTPFSSLRFLHLSPQKLSRRIQWHQVLLFLLRAAFLILLVFALTRPLVTVGDDSASTDRFIVLDVSHSMRYATAGGPTPMERAKELAADLVRRNRPDDRTTILLTGSQTKLLMPLSREPENHLSALADVQAGLTETDLCSALPVIRGMLGRPRAGASAEVWFLTDNQQHAWRQGPPSVFLDGLPDSVKIKVRVIDVGTAGTQNAWITRARLLSFRKPERRVLRVELGCVGDEIQERTLYLDAAGGMPARTHDITLTPGKPAVVDFVVPESVSLESGTLRFHLDESDGLPADDEYLLNLDSQGALRVLIVEGPPVAGSPDPSGFHIRKALESLADAGGQPLRTTTVNAVEAKPADFRGEDVIFLADVPDLGEEALSALEDRVRGGAGVAVVLGGSGKPAFLNERLYRPLHPADGLLPSPVRPVDAGDDPFAPLTGAIWTHPLLTDLADPLVGDLGGLHFRRWFEFTRAFDEKSTVLASIDDGAPALIDRVLGGGRVVILNTGADDRWSDLVKRKSFVPLIDRVLNHLAAAGTRRNFTVGEVVSIPLTDWDTTAKAEVLTPSGRRLTHAVRPSTGGRAILTFETDEAGIHRIERPGSSQSVVVQPGRGDSVLSSMDAEMLKQWWSPADFEVIRARDLDGNLSPGAGSLGLWPWLLLLGGLVLIVETYFVHHLCPQAGPKLIQNRVAPAKSVRA